MFLRPRVTTEALQGLKNAQLKYITERCGWPIGSSKSLLVESIVDGSTRSNFSDTLISTDKSKVEKKDYGIKKRILVHKQHRVLSIDMGIKNLALCLLSVPEKSGFSTQKSLKARSQGLPQLLAWDRFSVLDRVKTPGNGIEEVAKDDEHSPSKKLGDFPVDAAIFQPANFAPIATGLVRDLLDKYKPTLILIERQRHRSMGGSAIQEWTMRVNMFEAMLHAIIRMLIEDGHWSDGKVVSISPQRMTSFWLSNVTEDSITDKEIKPTKKISKSTKSKLLKIGIVKEMLQSGDTVRIEEGNESVRKIAKMFESLGSKRKKGEVIVEKEKLDDLADCLLQGLATIEWEKNRRLLLGNKLVSN